MGIRLDWEVESEGGSEAVAEDAVALAARRRRQVITQRAMIIGAVVVIVSVAFLTLRMRQVRAQMLDALYATVESEALALRLGNKDRFMLLQGASADWRSEQRRNFDIFQHSNPTMVVTDEILDLQMNGDEARVTVRVLVNDQESSAVWLYGYSTENGWRHIASEAEPWARQVIEANGYRIEYEITDQETAAIVDDIMRGWWFSASALSGVDVPLPITIVLDDQKQRMVWDDDNQSRLIMPSRDKDGRVTNLFDPGTFRAFSMRMADRWTEYVLNDREFAPRDIWIEAETQLWMRLIFDPQAIAPPVFSQLTNAFGVDFVPHLLSALRDHPNLNVEWAMNYAMSQSAPGAVVRGRLDRYFTRMLQAEFMFEQAWGSSQPQGDFNNLFAEPSRTESLTVNSQYQLYSGRLDPESISVFEVEEFGDLMWARVRFNYHTEVWPGSDTVTREMLIYVPFIERNGYWVHTTPTLNDWGSWTIMGGEGYQLMYHQLDGVVLGNSDELLNRWLTLYDSVASDFGMNPRLPYYLRLVIQPFEPSSFFTPYATDVSGPLMVIEIPSIFSYWGTANENFEFYWNKGGAAIIQEVYNYQSWYAPRVRGVPLPEPSFNYLPQAIVEWEMDRYDMEYQAWAMPGVVPPDADLPMTLADLWNVETGIGGHAEHAENSAQYIGAKVLIETLMERYGVEALPAMIANLTTTHSTDTWLFESVGIHAAEIEAEWFERYRQAMNAQEFNSAPSE